MRLRYRPFTTPGKTAKTVREFLRSKLNRRIIFLFVICSLIPLGTVFFLTYRQVLNHLNDQAFGHLRLTTKSISMSVYERLLFLQTEIEQLSAILEKRSAVPGQNPLEKVVLNPSERFDNLVWTDGSGRDYLLMGKKGDIPTVPNAYITINSENPKPLILSNFENSDTTGLYMALPVRIEGMPRGVIIGKINETYLWGVSQMNDLPYMTELTVIDPLGHMLFTTISQPSQLREKLLGEFKGASWCQFVWHHEKDSFLASGRTLFLEGRFISPNWIFALSQSETYTLGAIRYFQSVFPAVVLLSMLLVTFLTVRSVRKSMQPLEKLEKGARSVAAGDFKTRVNITSGDEFEKLGHSFNQMTQQLVTQFNELNLVAEIGQQSVSIAADMDQFLRGIVQTVLYWLQIRKGMILLSDPGSQHFIISAQRGIDDDKIYSLKAEGLDLRGMVLRSPIKMERQEDDTIQIQGEENLDARLTKKLLALANVFEDSLSVVMAPIVFENEILGLLVLENSADGKLFSENMRNLLMGITSQVAVSIAGILSYQKLEESEQRFRRVFDHAASGIALLNLHGGFLKTNTYLNSMLGYSEEELYAKDIHDLSHPEDKAIGNDSLRAMLNGEKMFDLFEKRLLNWNGKTLWVLISLSLLKDSRGKPLHFIVLIQDLTEQKRAEMERDRLEQQLQQSQKMEAIGTLAGGIAHDFNNILTAIVGFAQVGLVDKRHTEETLSLFEQIISAAQRAADLVRQILTFSRQQNKEMKPIQISGVIQEAINFVRATLPSNIEIQQNITEESGYILADATQMHQVILNLCTNAHHAMLPGGGVLTINLGNERIKRRLVSSGFDLKPGHYIKLSISDTGYGMDEGTLQKVFDPYFTTKEKGKGTGLGMAVVHGIIKNHEGMITLSSKPGAGTQVDIYLPRIYLESEQPKMRLDQGWDRGTERILLVDDEPDILKIGEQLLKHLGYDVTTSEDSQKALELALDRSIPYDLVITDLTMPRVSGDELAKTIHEKRPDMPVILCTGYKESITEAQCSEMGVSELLVKPFTLVELAQSIRRVLDRAKNSFGDQSE